MELSNTPKKINRIRTFASDAALLQKNPPPVSQTVTPKEVQVITADTPTPNKKPEIIVPKKEPLPPAPKKEHSPKLQETVKVAPTPKPVFVPVPKTLPVPRKKKDPAKPSELATEILNRNAQKGYVDLSDEVSTFTAPTHESVLSDDDDVFDVSQGSGTIIRDTRRKRFRLIPAMAEAFTDWLIDIKTNIEKVRSPKLTVSKAEARKEVIEAAVTQGQQAPKEDFAAVAKRMKSVERKAATSTLSFKEKSEVPAPTWTHVTDEDEKTEEQPKAAEVTIEEKAPVAHIVIPKPEITHQEIPAQAPEVPVTAVHEVVEEEATPKPIPTPTPKPTPVTPVAPRAEEFNTPVPQKVEQVPPRKTTPTPVPVSTPTRRPRVQRIIFVLTLVVVVLIMSALGAGISYYLFVLKDAPKEQAVQYAIPSLVQADPVALPLPSDRVSLLSDTATLVQQSQKPIEIYPTKQGSPQPATSEEILLVLAPQMPGSFMRAIKTITFGAALHNEPFVVLQVTSFDTAFAGMLQWERAMSADLVPLFGPAVAVSFDASARTSTQVRDAFFKDVIASNRNARLLQDEAGVDRITYTFVDQNTILITTSREALNDLLPLLK